MESFTQTSDKIYDRHDYRLFFSDGKCITFDNWYDVHNAWFKAPEGLLSHIEVLDKKTL